MANLFGQYNFEDTIMHRLDPRIKMGMVLLLSVLLFFFGTLAHFLLFSLFLLILLIFSRIRFINLLRNVRPFLLFFIFILLMYALFSREKIIEGLFAIWRFLLLIVIAAILTFTTSVSEMVYALEKLLKPLHYFGISSRNIAVMVAMTIRFIPLLFFEAKQVKDAQLSRMANPKKPKHIVVLLHALLRKTFAKARTIADAMEARCYRDKGYSCFRILKLRLRDYGAVFLIIIFIGLLFLA